MALYITRDGPCTAVNTWVNLSTFGGATLNQVLIPQGYNSIKEIWTVAIPDGGATDTQGCAFGLRLKGTGIKNGPADFAIGSWGNEQTGNSAIAKGYMAAVYPCDIGIQPGADFWIQGNQLSAADVGSPEIAATVVLTTAGSKNKHYIGRYVSDAAVVDTKYAVTGDGDGNTTTELRVPLGTNKISAIFAATGGLTLATASGGINFLRLEGNGLADGDVVLPINGISNLSTTTGVSDAFAPATRIPTDLPVKPGGSIKVYTEHTGVAWSTAVETYVTLEVE